ncbi:Hypothetical predicted protein, partial [Marmota monax]
MDGAFQGAPLLPAAISAAPYSSGRSLCAPPPRGLPHCSHPACRASPLALQRHRKTGACAHLGGGNNDGQQTHSSVQ